MKCGFKMNISGIANNVLYDKFKVLLTFTIANKA